MTQQQQQCHYPSRATNALLVVGGVIPAVAQLVINTYRYTSDDHCQPGSDEPDVPLVIASNLMSIVTAMTVSAYLYGLLMAGKWTQPCYTSAVPDRVKWLVLSLCAFWSISIVVAHVCVSFTSATQWCGTTLAPGFVPFVQAFANPINMLTFFSVMLYEDVFPGHDVTKCRRQTKRPNQESEKKSD
jgi:hypothetical protein